MRGIRGSSSLAILYLLAQPAGPSAAVIGQGTSDSTAKPARLEGVALDEVAPGSEVEKAGLRVGDVLRRWERLASPPANPEPAQGLLRSPFDWMWLEVEQVHRGPVILYGERKGEQRSWHVKVGEWNVHFNSERRGRSRARPIFTLKEVALYEQGQGQIRRGKLAEGAATWRRLAQVVAAPVACWLYLRIGEVWGEVGIWQQAHQAFQEAAKSTPDDRARVYLLEALGKSFEYQGRFREAQDTYREGLEIRRRLEPESLGVARSLHQIASQDFNLGNLDEAKKGFDQVLALRARWAPGSFLEADSLQSQGMVATERSDLENAEHFLKRSVAIQERLDPVSFWMAFKLSSLGDVYALRGDLEVAVLHFEKALEIRQRLVPDGESVATTLIRLGRLKLHQGQWQAGRANFERAQAILERVFPRHPMGAAVFNDLGDAALAAGDLDRAEASYRQALQLFAAVAPNRPWTAHSWSGLAAVEDRRGKWQAALFNHQKALELFRRAGTGTEGEARTLASMGRIAWRTGDLEGASVWFHRSIEALEAQVGRLGGSVDVKSDFRALRRRVYFDAAAVEIELGRAERAFDIQESARAQGFLSLLAARDLSVSDGIPPALEEERRRVGRQFRRALTAVAPSSVLDQADARKAWRDLPLLREQMDSISQRIRELSPGPSALHFPRPLPTAEIARELDPGLRVLAYLVGESATLAFVLSKNGSVSALKLGIGESAIRREVERFRAAAESRLVGREETGTRALRELYRALGEPVEPLLDGASRLLILPDGPLHAVPWAALVRELATPDPRTARSWQFFVETRPFTVALSATVWAELKRSRGRTATAAGGVGSASAGLPIAAFGDPVVRSSLPSQNPPRLAEVRLSGAVRRGLEPSPLPFSRREVESISQLFPGQVATYLGTEATEERAKGLPKSTRIVHFATHSWADERLPMSSGLLLTAPTTTDEHSEDGFLQAWEIFESVRLDADLVVLSACDSGRGRELGGEGLLSLSRAFQFAGARSVVASLWEVPDEGSGLLMERFYRHLKAGSTASDALREAQLEMIAQIPWDGVLRDERSARDLSRDFAWAAFEVFGDYR